MWDKLLMDIVNTRGQGWGIAGAKDGLTDWSKCRHPSGCVISGNLPRTLGYIFHPVFRHIGTDTFLARVADGINRLYLTETVFIEHRHWLNGKRPMDENYRWVYGKEEQDYGWAAVTKYLHEYLEQDLAKLRAAMEADGIHA
jgi:hypothetical protein